MHQIHYLLFLRRIRATNLRQRSKMNYLANCTNSIQLIYQQQEFASRLLANLVQFHRAHFLYGTNFASHPAVMIP